MSQLPPIQRGAAQEQEGGGNSEEEDRSAQLEQMARKVLEEIATVGTGEDVRLDEFIRILAEYRQDCENKAQYKEAELVHHVIKHLRLEEETRHVKGMTEQQEMERKGLEEAHALEFQNFNMLWNKKIDAFEEYQVDQEAAMLERHGTELSVFHNEMSQREPRQAKYSKELLNIRTIQQTLAAQRNYADAQRVKLQGDRQEEIEYRRQQETKDTVYERKRQQIIIRHQQELAALHARLERRKLELERARKKELEMLLQRYNNVRRGLEGQQNVIRSKTGNLLTKHALNRRTDNSGSNVIVTSMASGAFGPAVRRRHQQAHDDADELPPV